MSMENNEVDRLKQIILEIENLLGNPKKFIQEDAGILFEKWRKNIMRIYILSKGNSDLFQNMKVEMLKKLNAVFDQILNFDPEQENQKIQNKIAQEGLDGKINELSNELLGRLKQD